MLKVPSQERMVNAVGGCHLHLRLSLDRKCVLYTLQPLIADAMEFMLLFSLLCKCILHALQPLIA